MEFGIVSVEFKVIKNNTIVHSGNVPSFFLNALTDIYCDFKDSPYSLKIISEEKTILSSSPDNFDYREQTLEI